MCRAKFYVYKPLGYKNNKILEVRRPIYVKNIRSQIVVQLFE